MNHEDRSSPRPAERLNDLLRWYGAAAGLLASAPAIDAQVVYTDFPDATVRNSAFNIDFDLDGDPELTIVEDPGVNFIAGLADGASQGGPDEQDAVVGGTSFGYVYFLPLSTGQAISAGNVIPLVGFEYGPTFTYNNVDPGGWVGAGDRYAGVRFTLRPLGMTHYGWVRLSIPDNGVAVVKDFAYESAPNTPIAAGDRGAPVTLSGFVNQTTFPGVGGILIYTFTLTNGTGSPIPVRLEVTATRNGDVLLDRALGTGTLPAGFSITRSVPLPVPGSAPAGTYVVAYALVNPDTGQVVVAQAFTITKTAPPGTASGDGELFTATPPVELSPTTDPKALATVATTVAGRLLRTPSPIPRAARTSAPNSAPTSSRVALSVAGPNPFRDRASLTLEVPSTQAVRVAAYDPLGREVALLFDGTVGDGEVRRLVLDGSALPSGVYVVRAEGETFSDNCVLTLAR